VCDGPPELSTHTHVWRGKTMWELLVLLLLPLGTGRDKRKKNKPSKPGVGAEKTRAKTEKAEHKKLRRLERAAQVCCQCRRQ
jgi:hypothetical protein